MIKFSANTIQVHVVAKDEANDCYKFLALKRSKANPIYPAIWQAITGNIESGEKAIDCALREIKEETGLVPIKIWSIPYVTCFFDPYKDEVCFAPVFGALVEYQPNIRISPEHEDYRWLGLDEFVQLVPLPSHREGAICFWNYILKSDEPDRFLYKSDLT